MRLSAGWLALLILAAPAWADSPSAHHVVKVEVPAASVGQTTSAVVRIMVAAGFHLNEAYPTSMAVTYPSGVEGPSGKVKPKGMEKRETSFALPFTPREGGSKTLIATVRFAVCDDANTQCIPYREEVKINVAAK